MEDVTKIIHSEALLPEKQSVNTYGKKKNRKKKHFKEARKHLPELEKIVDETHQELEAQDSPFRLVIYQQDDDIYIDIVAIDQEGNTTQVFRHDISHDELEGLIAHIKSGRGLILDADA